MVDRSVGAGLGTSGAAAGMAEQLLERGDAAACRVEADDPAQGRHGPGQAGDHLGLLARGEDDRGAAVVEDEGHLFRGEHHVDGVDHGPGPQGGMVGDHPLPPVGRVQRDAVAGPHPDVVQAAGHPVAQVIELPGRSAPGRRRPEPSWHPKRRAARATIMPMSAVIGPGSAAVWSRTGAMMASAMIPPPRASLPPSSRPAAGLSIAALSRIWPLTMTRPRVEC